MSSTSHSLANMQCLVTGASRGIGFEIAARFSALGASCTIVGRNLAALEQAKERLQGHGEGSKDIILRAGDVSKREFWEGLGREMRAVDVLVNAAGVTHHSLLMATRPELVETVMQTNLMGTVWACQIVGKNMMRQKTGCIINISSLLGVKGGRGSSVYAASKAGVLGLTRSLAAEIGPSHVRVNAIVPGYIETSMTDDMTPGARQQALDTIPMNRFGKPEDVADAAVFLASNPYANNCILNLDGGLSAT